MVAGQFQSLISDPDEFLTVCRGVLDKSASGMKKHTPTTRIASSHFAHTQLLLKQPQVNLKILTFLVFNEIIGVAAKSNKLRFVHIYKKEEI